MGYLLRNRQDYKIVLTGHSLGGAAARITTFFMKYLDQFPGKTYELYTYGEPRAGNKAFVDYMNSLCIKSARVTSRYIKKKQKYIFFWIYPLIKLM